MNGHLLKKFTDIKYIAHRINSIADLRSLKNDFGVEIDLRDYRDNLVLVHDPFLEGEDFEEYLKNYSHGLIILNIKSERIEHRVIDLLKKYKIQNYFFLDSSFPMLVHLSNLGENNLAIRFSEFEPIENCFLFKGRARYVWVDCFTSWPLNHKNFSDLKNWGYQVVMVSPELQGRAQDVQKYAQYLQEEGIVPDFICSKREQILDWKRIFFQGEVKS